MDARLDTDVLVVGGGPAGSACASTLAEAGARVAVIEGGDFESPRIGETISGGATPVLRSLGIRPGWSERELGRRSTVVSAWNGTVAARSSMHDAYGAGWCVDRRRFDRMLFDHAGRAGASLWPRCRVTDARLDGTHWRFSARRDGQRLEGRAAFVVEATGRTGRSAFAPSGRRLAFDELTAVTWTTAGAMDAPDELGASCCVEAVKDGWWYSTPLQGGAMLVAFFTDGDLLARGRAAMTRQVIARLAETSLTRRRLASTEAPLAGWRAFDAGTTLRQTGATANWAAVGDALATIDPLSGQGVALALKSGMELARCIADTATDRRDAVAAWLDGVVEQFNRLLDERHAVYAQERRWDTSLFWQRRRGARTAQRPR
jgi:flavin-dependent dehydrogenase